MTLEADGRKVFSSFQKVSVARCLTPSLLRPEFFVAILEVENFGLRRGTVDFGGYSQRSLKLLYTEGSHGRLLLARVGFALTILDEQEAHRLFEVLRELDQLEKLRERAR